MSADLLARLIEAGTPAALVGEVAMALGRAQGDQAALAARRERDAERQRERRERGRLSRDITLRHVTSVDSVDAASSLDKETSPRPPKEINPNPGVIPAAREEPDFSVRLSAVVAAWFGVMSAIAAQRRKRWKNMPPPAGVSDEQWRGYLHHRTAKRKSLTDHAYTLICGKLAKLSSDEWPPGRLVDLMTERGWLSVEQEWIPKTAEQQNGQRSHHQQHQGNQHPGGRSCAASDFVFGGDGMH